MPREKGRPGHATVRNDTDVGKKHAKIAALVPVVDHLRLRLDSQPDYSGMSDHLDDAVDDVVNDILESPVEDPVRISLLFRAVLESPVEINENSIHWNPPPVVVLVVREVELNRGFVALVDDEDYERVCEHTWEASFTNQVYALRKYKNDDGRTARESLHDFLMSPPDGFRVEHVDGDRLNCQRENLRLVEVEPKTKDPA
ncbi:HNH endonuclease [Lentzea atacamensis]|uniref:HNH endonuclease n=1 Tax=Lentzea atacamensis TaxID=531938 RepID=UPI000DD3DA37|nr:HNH endonuclease [Lentzea atacamensis]